MKIPFNKPPLTGNEQKHVLKSMQSAQISGDGHYSAKCHKWFIQHLDCQKALLTSSCTHALEMAGMLIDVQPGDEIIMPSYTFVSTANAFVLRGAKIVFVDIRTDTMNIDEQKIVAAITPKTKAIVPVHYAGVSCEMEQIMDIANQHGLYVVEDAAQAMTSKYRDQPLGTIGHIGTFSFHETKNYTSAGEGGLLIINDEKFKDRAEIIREKGTNRSLFFRGMVDKYSWVDIGSSYLMNDISAAYLWGQLEQHQTIKANRLKSWNKYFKELSELAATGFIELPSIPLNCKHNAHMFYIKVSNLDTRSHLIEYLKEASILSVFHYVPLHSAPAGINFGRFSGVDEYTTVESERILRLPLFYGIKESELQAVIDNIKQFFKQ